MSTMALAESTSAVGGIRGYLLKLHSLLGNAEAKYAALQCHDIIGDLGQECIVTTCQSDQVFQMSLLLSKEEGLLSFLQKSLEKEELRDVRVEILGLLEKLLQKSPSWIKSWEKYIIDIKDTCLLVYTKDKAAKSRVTVLELLIKVMYMLKDLCVAVQDCRVADMFSKFYGELCQRSKLPDTVLGTIYELLGVLGEVQPSEMVNNSEKLFKAYLGELKSQMTSFTKEPKLPLVAGCLKGISALMVNFTKSVDEDPKTSKEIFDFAYKAITPQTEMKRYAVPLAGLRLFARHGGQFSRYLVDCYSTIFDVMSKWCGHINAEVRKTSVYALESFLKQVADVIKENVEEHKTKLKFFMQKFCAIIKNTDSTQKDLSVAIRGYGLFAAPCKMVCSQDVDFMFTELMQRCKQIYLTESDTEDDNIYQLPSFLDSIASVLSHLDRIPEVYIPVLEHLVVFQIDCFPQYSQKMLSICCRSVVKVFIAIAEKGPVMWNFISTVVHQSLIRVCSKPILESEGESTHGATDALVQAGKWKTPSCRDYLDLFRGLLDCEPTKDYGSFDITSKACRDAFKSLSRLIHDELIKSVLKIIEKLDLSVQKQNAEETGDGEDVKGNVVPSSDPTADLLPNRPKDFMAFVNLVDFCNELLLHRDGTYFEQWIYPFAHELILKATKFPLVSGFYRLLSIAVKIAKKIKYFQGVDKSLKNDQENPKYSCFALLLKFAKETLVRMKQYKDELLASCLIFVLSVDPDIVSFDIKAYIPALKEAFKLGLSHPPLACAALDALDEWSHGIPAEDIQPYYKDILPCLDEYFKMPALNGGANDCDVLCLSLGEERGYGKVLMRLLKKSKQLSLGEESPSALVRLRIVKLLGHLGGQLNKCLATDPSTEEMNKFVAWDFEKRLSFAVPFTDMKPLIYLDSFLPRVTELALSSTDRQTKVVACELLHSIVIFMVGRSSQIPEGEKSMPPMYSLYKRTFPVLLHLACDVDQVTRQLYEPLVMQLIHWFTSNKKFESQDTVALLEAILEGLVDPLDSTLRDFGGQCIYEFFKWSVKQTTSKQQEKSSVNIKSVFKRIYSLALHPNVFKRLGAALAFNSIYKVFREEKTLVDQYIFEALFVYLESLALAHSDEKTSGTMQQCCDAIGHMKKIIKYKAATLNQSIKRRIPRGFPSDTAVSLLDVVMCLLVQSGRPQTECRHKCLELFYEFLPLLPGNKNQTLWVEDLVKQHTVGFLIKRFEGGGHEKCLLGLLSQATLYESEGPFNVQTVLQWMDMLLAALDCYNTFIGLHMIKPHQIFGTEDKSNFLKGLHFFITELAMHDISAAEKCFSVGPQGAYFSVKEASEYNYSKGTIIVRLLEFVTMVLDKGQQNIWKLLEKDILSTDFFQLIASTVCEPSTVGFEMADVEVMTKLPKVCVALMKALVPTPYKHNLEGCIKNKMPIESVEALHRVNFYDPTASACHAKLWKMLSACKQLHQAGLLSTLQSSGDANFSFGCKVLSNVYEKIASQKESVHAMDVSSKKLADGLLQLGFSAGAETKLLLQLLLKNTMLSVTMRGTSNQNCVSFSHGEYFYSLFQMTVNSELLKNLDVTMPLLMKAAADNWNLVSTLLNGMLDHCFRERALRKNQGNKLVQHVVKNWSSMRPWWAGGEASSESKMAILTLLSKLLQIDSAVCLNDAHEAFQDVFISYTSLVSDDMLPLNLKSYALIILPFFTILPEDSLSKLQKALDLLVANHFPMQSHEFLKGSLDYNNYVDCIKKFLDALELSQSPMLLKLMSEIICRDQKHIIEEHFQTCFRRTVIRSRCERQVLLLSRVYETFHIGTQLSNIMCQRVLERTLLTLMLHCSSDALRDFFVKNVTEIMTTLQGRFTKSNEMAFETQVIKKSGCYKLMEVLYSRLSKEEVYSKESKVNQAFCAVGKCEGNELSKALLKSCFEAFTENMVGETQLLQQRRQYHCSAYNCAMAVVTRSFNETKFYQGFLFTEKPDKNQFVLENIIDTQRTYRFPVEIEIPLERQKRIVTIKKQMNETKEGDVFSSSHMMSSLSEEMSQFDFSTGVQSFSCSFQDPVNQATNQSEEQMEISSQDDIMEFEMDELNQHECMAAMTSLLNHMQRNNITPKLEQGVVPTELPQWMKFLHGKLANPSTYLNVRLFIAKLIINAEEIFRPYAHFWLGPLLQLVVSEKNGGEGIHFMVVDIVVTMLSWADIATPKGSTRDEILANRLIEFLINNCFHSRRAVYRHNLEIIRTVFQCWKDCFVVPYSLIYERFAGTDHSNKDNSVGLQLLGIALASGLPPYDSKCGIEQGRYIRSLVFNLSFIRYKEIYSAGAEIIGLTMHNMAEKNSDFFVLLLDQTAAKLKDLERAGHEDKFIVCLSRISKHFPPFVDRFVNQVLFLLPKMHGVLKTHCLECVLSRASEIPDVYLHLKRKDLLQLLGHRDEARQRVCLDIVHKILPSLKPEDVKEMLNAVTNFVSHPSAKCRERMYDILMWIHDNYNDTESQSHVVSIEVFTQAKEVLLQGLMDINQGLQLYVRNFWSNESRMPKCTHERMIEILHSFYSCKIETHFLSLATNLLLEMTSHSPDYGRALYDYPLSECKFQDYVIDSSWRHRSTVLTPMFVSTQTMQDQSSSPSQNSGVAGHLRATQDTLEFTPTQMTDKRTTYNWLTGSSSDTLAEYPIPSSESFSSLLVFGKMNRPHVPRKPLGEDFGTKRLTSPEDEQDSRIKAVEQKADILRLKRRFLKDHEKVSLQFAKKGIQEQKQLKVQAENQKLQKEAKVILYRNYRQGELPDIQIPYKSLITPLQALAERDPILAKQLFASLFLGILVEVDSSKPLGERRKICEDLLEYMNNLLSKSSSYFPPFVGCVQEMCYQKKELLHLHPACVSSSCLASLQQPIGILLLEENLVNESISVDQQPPAKRARKSRDQQLGTEHWIHLAKLYRSLGDFDVVRGIFSGKIGTKTFTRDAIKAEGRSDYAEAVKLYNEALNTDVWIDGAPTEAEKDFWELAALEAYNNLAEWKSLQYCATVNIDSSASVSIDKIWTDPYYQDVYLPYLMRSMLKQLLQGEQDQSLLSFVDGAMKIEERKNIMESQYSQELSLLYILQEDYERAKFYIKNCMQMFIQSYSAIDVLLNASRLAKLQSVQSVIEINDFLQFIARNVSLQSVRNLIQSWTQRYPDVRMDPMNVWDDVITTRCFFLDKISEKLSAQMPLDTMELEEIGDVGHNVKPDTQEELNKMIRDCKFTMRLTMANSARKQSNMALATKLLKELHREAKTESSWLQLWVHSFSRFSHRRSQNKNSVEQILAMLKVISLLEEIQSGPDARAKAYQDNNILMGTTYSIMASAISRDPTVLETVGSDKGKALLQLSGASPSSGYEQVIVGLQRRAFEFLHTAAENADADQPMSLVECSDSCEAMKAYMTLANFCDKALREEERSSFVSQFPELLKFPAIVVEMMLKALRLNSKEARMKFPRLLQLVELYPEETINLMAREVSSVPCWQLLTWISQMIALLDKKEAHAVQQIIQEIVESYPQALIYPFMISCESFTFHESPDGHRNKEFVTRLRSQLDKDGIVKDFVDALQQLTNPEMLFKDWWDTVKNELEKLDKTMMEKMYKEMYFSLGNERVEGLGSFRKKFIQKFSKEIQALLGVGGSQLFQKKKDKAFLRKVDELAVSMRGVLNEPGNLKEYSPWMSNFSVALLQKKLEVPGQYDGRSKPLPEYHAKIAGFDERVKVMTSIRKPKRLIIRGDDEHEYPFLVKGGEDLRQDQRIEQLFSIMNEILSQDAICSQRKLSLHTYQVIPMTTRIGLIEWKENTCTLKDFLSSRRTEDEQKNATRPNEAFEKWLTKIAGKTEGILRYGEVYKKAKRMETVANYKKIEQLVPEDLLRRAFIRMSTTPEAFLMLRSHFMGSHALMCISHWILGIGDRHLSNFLINLSTGGMVGIDFGHAFGSATQFLPVPELMPFRLTQQFLNLMRPMQEKGLIESTMIHTLRAYRADPELLLNTMDIFVKEPSLDWKNFELKQLKKGGTWMKNVNTKKVNWYPEQKVNFARRKLEGVNPAVIICEELKLGFEGDPAFSGMMAVARGERDHNIRACQEADGLSVETQVNCLLDQATDPNILGRVWVGWEPWL